MKNRLGLLKATKGKSSLIKLTKGKTFLTIASLGSRSTLDQGAGGSIKTGADGPRFGPSGMDSRRLRMNGKAKRLSDCTTGFTYERGSGINGKSSLIFASGLSY